MKRIIIHWTGGGSKPNTTDREHYHYLIDKDGRVSEGKFPVSANEVCRNDVRNKPLYAAHTGGGNTGSIGIAMCGMYVPKNSNIYDSPYLLTQIQCERCFKLIAEMSIKYNIAITAENVMTHYEFGIKHPNTTSAGKIDIVYLPPYKNVKANEVGEFIRGKARWYRGRLSV